MSAVPLVRPIGGTKVPPGLAQRTFALALWFGGVLAREVRIRRDMRRLAEFNDHMLRDIGIARADLEGAVRRGRDGSEDMKRFGQNDAAHSMCWPPLRR